MSMFQGMVDKIKEPVGKVGKKVGARAPFKKVGSKKAGAMEKKGGAVGEKAGEKVGAVGEKVGAVGETISAPLVKVREKVGEKLGERGPLKALEEDTKLGRTLHSDVIAAMNQLQEKHPDIKELLEKAYGYAVLPSVGRASLVLGGAYGVGEVFVKDRVIGYATVIELTVGVQLGGTTFHELIVFNDQETWKEFKDGKYAFAADASVAFVKAGAQASKGFGANTAVFVFNEGGMLLDLAIGLQKFTFKPTAVGMLRTSDQPEDKGQRAEDADAEAAGVSEEPPSEQRTESSDD